MKLVAFILSNNSYEGIEITVNKVPDIIDDFFISEDSKDKNILEIAKKNNYKLIYNHNLELIFLITSSIQGNSIVVKSL